MTTDWVRGRRGGVRRVFLADEAIGAATAPKVWTKSRLRDRIEAVIVHEHLEAQGIPQDEVVERAADTDLPIGENARRILRRIAEGVRRRGGG